jgi:hypothetical protein
LIGETEQIIVSTGPRGFFSCINERLELCGNSMPRGSFSDIYFIGSLDIISSRARRYAILEVE